MSDIELASVGQHFIIGLRPTTALHPSDRRLLREIRPAGVILFKSTSTMIAPTQNGCRATPISSGRSEKRYAARGCSSRLITRAAAFAARRRQSQDSRTLARGTTMLAAWPGPSVSSQPRWG